MTKPPEMSNAPEDIVLGYKRTIAFLKLIDEATPSEEIKIVLSFMHTLPDGSPADPAMWAMWLRACARAADPDFDVSLVVKP